LGWWTECFLNNPLKPHCHLQWEVKAREKTSPSESKVNEMYENYNNSGGNVTEEIQLLNSISCVSARLARNLATLTARSKSEKGGKANVKDGRYGTDHRRPAQSRCCY
jgi:hypothetical protein